MPGSTATLPSKSGCFGWPSFSPLRKSRTTARSSRWHMPASGSGGITTPSWDASITGTVRPTSAGTSTAPPPSLSSFDARGVTAAQPTPASNAAIVAHSPGEIARGIRWIVKIGRDITSTAGWEPTIGAVTGQRRRAATARSLLLRVGADFEGVRAQLDRRRRRGVARGHVQRGARRGGTGQVNADLAAEAGRRLERGGVAFLGRAVDAVHGLQRSAAEHQGLLAGARGRGRA